VQCYPTVEGNTCECSPGYAGYDCTLSRCWEVNDQLGCWWAGAYTECVVDELNVPICACTDGYSGSACSQTATCAGGCPANSYCMTPQTGALPSCVCNAGYMPLSSTFDPSADDSDCTLVQPDKVCGSDVCMGNFECVLNSNNVPECVCPFTRYGGSECNKPRCQSDTDCTNIYGYALTSFCVTDTNDNVASYCECEATYTGYNCNQNNPCNYANCQGAQCDNQGWCACPPGQIGQYPNCTSDSVSCVATSIVLNTNYLGTTVQLLLANLVHIDWSTILVSKPKNINGNFNYTISFCSNADINGTLAFNTATALFNQKNFGGLPIVGFANDSAASVMGTSMFALLALLCLALF